MRWVSLVVVTALAGCSTADRSAQLPKPDFEPLKMRIGPGLPEVEEADIAGRIRVALLHLNDNPDWLHGDHTPAVSRLSEIGEPAIEPTLPLLMSANEWTREHAQVAIYGTIARMHGFVTGHGWQRTEGEGQCRRIWQQLWDDKANRNKDIYQASPEARAAFIEKTKAWLAERRATRAALCGGIIIPPT